MFRRVRGFLKHTSGTVAIEYGLIAALLSVAGIAAIDNFGTSLASAYGEVAIVVEAAAQTGKFPP